jgi:hypothetical protein
MSGKMTEEGIRELAEKWYKLLDVHAPITEFLPLLHDDLEMVFPEATLKGQGAFSEWLAVVVRIFFDEEHTVKEVKVDFTSPDSADVKVVVNWKARRWKAPAATAEYLDFDAYQTWVVKASPQTGEPVIATYVVDRLEPQPGSAEL